MSDAIDPQESYPIRLAKLQRELAAMQAQRDRLAEALEHIATHGGRHQAPLRDSIDNIARNALAAVEGGQP